MGPRLVQLRADRLSAVAPSVATGLRVLLDRSSGANLVLDVGWAPGGRVGFYLNANETF